MGDGLNPNISRKARIDLAGPRCVS
jgi:hypothetical protein